MGNGEEMLLPLYHTSETDVNAGVGRGRSVGKKTRWLNQDEGLLMRPDAFVVAPTEGREGRAWEGYEEVVEEGLGIRWVDVDLKSGNEKAESRLDRDA